MTENDAAKRTERLRYVLEGIHGWNKSVDGKAGFIAGFATLALGWTIDEAGSLAAATAPLLVVIAAAVLACGAGLAAAAVFPVVSPAEKPWSALFFQDIADRFAPAGQLGEAAGEYVGILDATFETTLAEQVLVNAMVARRKFKLIKCSMTVTFCGTLLVMVLHLFSALPADLEPTDPIASVAQSALTLAAPEEYGPG